MNKTIEPGIYRLEQCGKHSAIGYVVKKNENDVEKTFPFCIMEGLSFDAWAYLWVRENNAAEFCFSMEPYVSDEDGFCMIGGKVADCYPSISPATSSLDKIHLLLNLL